ncbi:MAG: biotin--[acetyl-CoA-carboxylase] ligase [Pyrinomonadaceae bacterium]|nr:biotin--[acetyl-CoA-carboxylase] ligase [Pyrinomonadaceae bacterium]
MRFTLLRYDSIDSTNTEAINQAKRGAEEGLCIVAREQIAGRGRHGRTWVSEKDAGLYFSLVLRPKIEIRLLPLITLMTAVAVHQAIESAFKIECDIKWVNDIHVDGKKICGILAETVETEKGLAVIVGIGINLKSSNFPPELAETATSIEKETGADPNVETFLPVLTSFFEKYCDLLYEDAAKIRAEWSQRSSYAFGKVVRIMLENETIYGTTRGIEENGALRLELETGELRIIHTGEVEQVRQVKSKK